MGYNNNGFKLFRAVLIGTGIGLLICTVLLILATITFLQVKSIPVEAISVMVQIFGAIGAFAGSYITVRIAKEKGMILGVATAGLLFVFVLLAGLCATTSTITFATAAKGLAMLISGCLGGIVAVNKKQKVKRFK